MSKFLIIFTLVSSIILASSGTGQGTIINNLPIKFRVYQHEYQSGPNASVYEVARASITATSPTEFGSLRIGNILITSGPDQNTGKLGRIEGLVAYTGRTEASGILHLVFTFTEGKYKGSSISLLGRKTVAGASDEVPIAAVRACSGWRVDTHSRLPILTILLSTILFTFMISMFTVYLN